MGRVSQGLIQPMAESCFQEFCQLMRTSSEEIQTRFTAIGAIGAVEFLRLRVLGAVELGFEVGDELICFHEAFKAIDFLARLE